MFPRVFCLVMILSVGMFSFAAAETVGEEHLYLQTTGATSDPLTWQLLDGEPIRLKTRVGSAEDLTILDASLATREWQLQDQQEGTAIRVSRTGNLLRISGRFHGKPIDQRKEIDPAPWFQTLSLSLRAFLRSGQKATGFWMLRPDTLQSYKLQAVKKGTEEIEVQGERIPADKVEIHLTGFGALFWKARYWFRSGDQLFVRYAGPSGPPGAPKTVVNLSSAVPQAASALPSKP